MCEYICLNCRTEVSKMANSFSFVFLALAAIASVKAASIGDALVTIYADSFAAVPEYGAEVIRSAREAEPLGLKGHHHHHHSHHQSSSEEYYSKPTSCIKCGGGGGGPVATFAQSSAGTISGGQGGHGGLGSNSVSQSAAYNFGPFSASFSASQSNANGGGLYGGFF